MRAHSYTVVLLGRKVLLDQPSESLKAPPGDDAGGTQPCLSVLSRHRRWSVVLALNLTDLPHVHRANSFAEP